MNSVITMFGNVDKHTAVRQFNNLYDKANEENANLLVTKATNALIEHVQDFKYKLFDMDVDNSHIKIEGRTIAVLNNKHVSDIKIMVVSAGLADEPIKQETELTIKTYGYQVTSVSDAGINNLERIFNNVHSDGEECAIVSIQGFEGALAPIIASHSSKPVISVPTSTGYGIANNGTTALNTSLTSCTPGISVVNVDNGFGGAVCAIRIANQIERGDK